MNCNGQISMYIMENNISSIVLVKIKLNLQLKKRFHQLRNDLFNWCLFHKWRTYIWWCVCRNFPGRLDACKISFFFEYAWKIVGVPTSQHIISYHMHVFFLYDKKLTWPEMIKVNNSSPTWLAKYSLYPFLSVAIVFVLVKLS